MFRSYMGWFWRRAMDCFATVGILAFLLNSTVSDKFFDEIPGESSMSLEIFLLRLVKMCSGCIFNVIFSTRYFCSSFLRKLWCSFRWLRGNLTHPPLVFVTALQSWADNIYILCWFKTIQYIFTLVESAKSEVVFRIGKANSAMMNFTYAISEIRQEYHFYPIQPFVVLIATFNVIRTCLKLVVSLIALIAATVTEFCIAVIFDFLHMPCSAPENQSGLRYLMATFSNF